MNKADKYFIETLKEIMTSPYTTNKHMTRTVWSDTNEPAHTRYITQVFHKYDISKGEYPICSIRPLAWKSAIKEILWIYQDQTNDLDVLEDKYNIHWWNAWEVKETSTEESKRNIGQRYGATVKRYNLMNNLLNTIKNNPMSRRMLINMYQYADINETPGLDPCAYQTNWVVRGEFLDMTLTVRSNDFVAAGNINTFQYFALLLMVAKATGYKPGQYSELIINCHVYDRHEEFANELISREEQLESVSTPRLILDTDKTDFYSFTIDDFKLENYSPLPALDKKIPIAE